MKLGLWGLVLFCFTAGFVTATLFDTPQHILPRSPLAAERASPQDWVSESQIKVYKDEVVLEIPNAKWATFADTNSMDPFIDAGANAIQVVPNCPADLHVGDVVTYDAGGKKIIHRIVEKGVDGQGAYFIMKGDNNPEVDPGVVRCDRIERVTIGVIY